MGWTYNVVDPNVATNAPTVAGVGITFTILSFSIVCLRLYVRKYIVKAINIDDWLIVVTWFFSFIFVCITLAQTRWGLGLRNVEDMPPQDVYEFGYLQYIGAPFYICAILGFKLSIIFAFLRIAVDRTYRIGIICISITCSAFYFCFFVAQLNFCFPVSKSWDPTITTGSCFSAVLFYTAMGSLTFIFDILTMLTPIPILLHSCFSPCKNFMIAFLYLLGIFLSLIQILRITSLRSARSYLDTSTVLTWSLVEVNLGIILSSLIPLAPLPVLQSFLEKGSPQSLAQSLASFDTRRTIDKVRDGFKKRFGRESELRNRVVLFLGYGELRPDLEREQRPGSRLGASTEELNFPMGILKTTEVIISREGSSWGELKEEDV
ncbi:uncharacterized protein LY89DRAFT_623821 [Mollisia scopiformis]|uniref:Rhodopsin domain-containing protein n=1 Tax=Mollisia scopiformis TaxID=149040 RepID=A0A194WYD7_MOLSC|nr:uncharacterized protein LY89DRAFT_623821 [Mollisia scopiformis]KUJ12622.1 hypothetical protein LY89DRAFT_623821 [Mollisia scopiformis]